jgi:hypothetical protein
MGKSAASPNVFDAMVAMDEKGDMASVAGEIGSGIGSDCKERRGGKDVSKAMRGEGGVQDGTYIVDSKIKVV